MPAHAGLLPEQRPWSLSADAMKATVTPSGGMLTITLPPLTSAVFTE